ncbi:conserved protein of unknown function [Blastococcus saxobsidens DD2]|uniref:Transposase n=1 Tax=Blastococcus saxobsidens (strain DD2) TaxID=1146883 RepID=H6RKV5_BLASD|nr:conserved protein of unknown function [Blastococcus saxobsidens DD2]
MVGVEVQVLSGSTSEAPSAAGWAASTCTRCPCLPQEPGYDKRLRRLSATVIWLIHQLAVDTSIRTGDVWMVDSTPIECGRSRESVLRSELAG